MAKALDRPYKTLIHELLEKATKKAAKDGANLLKLLGQTSPHHVKKVIKNYLNNSLISTTSPWHPHCRYGKSYRLLDRGDHPA